MHARADAYIVTYAIVALGIVAAIAAVAMVGYVIYYYIFRGLFAPVSKTRARVVSKEQRQYDVDVPLYVGPPGVWGMLYRHIMMALGRDTTVTVYQSYDYFVTFALGDGQEQEFAVPEITYTDVHEGDEGILSYKGSLFKFFLPLQSVTRR